MLLSFTGCSFKQEASTKYYGVEFSKNISTYTQTPKTIAILKPTLNAPYASKDIFFTRKPFLFEQYSINKWVELPNLMIQNLLYDTFVATHLYTNVGLDNSKVNYDLQLQSNITKLFHAYENNQSFAIVHIQFNVIENNKSIHALHVEKKILCDENTPYGFIKATNKAFEEITQELLNSLQKTI
jgi:cholesterol transport system auxiliary component